MGTSSDGNPVREEPERSRPAPIPVEKRITAINSVATALEHVINLVLVIWLQQFLLARIPVEEYATYVVVVTPLLLAPLLVGALSNAVGRFVIVRQSEGDEAGAGRVVSTSVVLAGGIALLFGALAVPLYIWIGALLAIPPGLVDEARTMLALLVGLTLVRILTAPLVVGPFVRQRFVLQSSISLGTQLLRLLLIVSLLLLVEVRVLWVVVGTVGAELVGLVATLLVSRRLLPALRFRPGDVRWSEAPTLAAFGGWMFFKGSTVVGRRAAEPVILNRMAGAFDVTCFHLGVLVMTQLQLLMGKVMQPLLPPLAALHARGDKESLRRLFLRINRLGFLVALFIWLPSTVYREELVTLYVGEEFLDAGAVLALLLLQLPLRWSAIMVGPLSTAMDRQRVASLGLFGVNFLSLVAIALALRSDGGAVGAAAWAITATALVTVTVIWPLGWRLVDVPALVWARRCLLPALLPALAGLTLWASLHEFVAPTSWSALFACFLVGATAFLGVGWFTAAGPEDREDLRKLLAGLGRRVR